MALFGESMVMMCVLCVLALQLSFVGVLIFHLQGVLELFRIVSEGAISAGVHRMRAVTAKDL